MQEGLSRRLERFRSEGGDSPLELATALIEAARSAEALEVVEAALAAAPNDAGLLVLAGRAHGLRGDALAAEASLLRAVKADPRNAAAYRWLGELLLARKDPSRAARALERGLGIDPKDQAIAQLLESAREQEKRPKELERRAAQEAERERHEQEKRAAAQAEMQRTELERRQELERREAELLAERAEAERVHREQLEQARLTAEREHREQLEAERQRVEREHHARLEAERREAERRQAEQLEIARKEAERALNDRLERERLAAERVLAERLETERRDAQTRLTARETEIRARESKLEALTSIAQRRIEEVANEEAARELERKAMAKLAEERKQIEALKRESAEAARKDAERLEADRADAERIRREADQARADLAAAAEREARIAEREQRLIALEERLVAQSEEHAKFAQRVEAEASRAERAARDVERALAMATPTPAPPAPFVDAPAIATPAPAPAVTTPTPAPAITTPTPAPVFSVATPTPAPIAVGTPTPSVPPSAPRSRIMKTMTFGAARAPLPVEPTRESSPGTAVVLLPPAVVAEGASSGNAEEPSKKKRAKKTRRVRSPDELTIGGSEARAFEATLEPAPRAGGARWFVAGAAAVMVILCASAYGIWASAVRGRGAATAESTPPIASGDPAIEDPAPEPTVEAPRPEPVATVEPTTEPIVPEEATPEEATPAPEETATAEAPVVANVVDPPAETRVEDDAPSQRTVERLASRTDREPRTERRRVPTDSERYDPDTGGPPTDARTVAITRTTDDNEIDDTVDVALLNTSGRGSAGLDAIDGLIARGQLAEAEAALAALTPSDRTSAAGRTSAARWLLASHRAEEAVRELEPLAAGEQAPAGLLALYGRSLLAVGRVAEASRAYVDALDRDPNQPDALLGRAEMAVRARNATEALYFLRRLDRALERTRRTPAFRARVELLRGRAMLVAGNDDDARRTLRDVIERPNPPSDAFFHYAESQIGHDHVAARLAYHRYLELEPNGFYARRARRALGDDPGADEAPTDQ